MTQLLRAVPTVVRLITLTTMLLFSAKESSRHAQIQWINFMTIRQDSVTLVPQDICWIRQLFCAKRRWLHAHQDSFMTTPQVCVSTAGPAKHTTTSQSSVSISTQLARVECTSTSILANASTVQLDTFMIKVSSIVETTAQLIRCSITAKSSVSWSLQLVTITSTTTLFNANASSSQYVHQSRGTTRRTGNVSILHSLHR